MSIQVRNDRVRVLLLALSLLTSFLAEPVALADPLDEFYALEDELIEAQDSFAAAAHNSGGDAGGYHGKSAANDADPRLAILRKIDALAEATVGQKGAATIAAGAFMWSWNLDLDLEGLVKRFDNIVRHHADEEVFDEVLLAVADAGKAVGDPADWIRVTQHLIKKTKRAETRVGALFSLGQIQLDARMMSAARDCFNEVAKTRGKSELVDLAKGYIYEIDHLQVGMVAPSFTAKTLDGNKVSLKSLRGKTVLLNFWATW